mmetsp:Transcript_12582/g.14382  ORF Transcript_12582/g.14382 Transcript_12582/m.14382 type:complete len:263 (-) Transcript_12582:1522-2310(-)
MSYIPMVAATNGTLSIKADAKPITVAIISRDGRFVLKNTASSFNKPLLSNTPMDIRIPKKNKIPAVSNLESAAGTLRPSSASSPMCRISVNVHMAPNPVNIAKYGGRPVNSAKTGTNRSEPMPLQNTKLPRGANFDDSGNNEELSPSSASSSSTWLTKTASDPIRQTKEGRKRSKTVGSVDKLLLIQSIVVVTSPIGVHTPPAFAATTTMPPNNLRSFSLGINFLRSEHITIVTVKLFKMALRKNVRKPIVQNSSFFELVLI